MDQPNKLLEKVKSILSIPATQWRAKTQQEWKPVFDAYFLVFGRKKDITCGDCVLDAYFEIKEKFNNNKIIEMSERKFLFTPATVLQIPRSAMQLTNDNLTDDHALGLLARSKGYLKFFAKFPENWEELLAAMKESSLENEISKQAGEDVTAEENSEVVNPQSEYNEEMRIVSTFGQKKLRTFAIRNTEKYGFDLNEFGTMNNDQLKKYVGDKIAAHFKITA